jgi:hypothetical protein
METEMIERIEESHKAAFGFKITGKLTADDVATISAQMEHFIGQHKKPIGLLADLSEMEGASWAARWEEMRFLQRHSDHIARLAVISNDEWEDVSKVALVAAAALQAQTLYFQPSCMALDQDGQNRRIDADSSHVSRQRFVSQLHFRIHGHLARSCWRLTGLKPSPKSLFSSVASRNKEQHSRQLSEPGKQRLRPV